MDGSPSRVQVNDPSESLNCGYIQFQAGPTKEVGLNGTTIEHVLGLLIKRLEGFQQGAFANDWNEEAIYHMVSAVDALERRTYDRQARDVEGTNQV